MGQAYVITSGKGGVGKTLTVFNLGVGLSMLGKKVVLIDADICLPNLDKVAGLEDEAKAIREIMDINGPDYNLEYFLKHSCLLEYLIIRHREYKNLSFIPAYIIGSGVDNRRELMEDLVLYLKDKFDYILIDSPSGIDESFINAVLAADKALVVTTPDVTSVRDADTVIGKLEDYGIMDNMLIINRVDERIVEKDSIPGNHDIMDILGIELLGIVPEDKEAIVCSHRGIPVVTRQRSKAGKAYGSIARHIAGGYMAVLEERPDPGKIMHILPSIMMDCLMPGGKLKA